MVSRHSDQNIFIEVMIFINRLALGFYFTDTGIGKFRMGLENFYIDRYLKMAPDWLPDLLLKPYGYALPFAEVFFGILLMLGFYSRSAATGIMLMLVSIIIAQMNMGSFFHGPGVRGPYHANLIMLTLSLWLITSGAGKISLDFMWFKNKRRH